MLLPLAASLTKLSTLVTMPPSSKPILLISVRLLLSLLLLHSVVNALVLKVTKDVATTQYVTQIHAPHSPKPSNLVVDLGSPFLWIHCATSHLISSSRPISASSPICVWANSHHQTHSQPHQNITSLCTPLFQNRFAGLTARGRLLDSLLTVGSETPPAANVVVSQNSVIGCAPTFLLQGLARGSHGVLGLATAQIPLLSPIPHRRLAICLSPSIGVVSTGSPEELFGTEVTRSLVYTPLVAPKPNPSGRYVIGVKALKIDGKRLPINVPLSAELSTVVPYMMMESGMYAKFVEAYVKAAGNWKMVEAVAPFGVCYGNRTGSDWEYGKEVELVLQSEMVKWKIGGKRVMVDVGNGVWCLGILDAGPSPHTPILIGALQLEDYVLDFDLGNSVVGFGPTTCSNFAPS